MESKATSSPDSWSKVLIKVLSGYFNGLFSHPIIQSIKAVIIYLTIIENKTHIHICISKVLNFKSNSHIFISQCKK